MHRYATEPRSTFEELFAEAGYGTVVLEGAVYPPVCGRHEGEVTLSLGPTGAMIVHAERCPCSSEEFRLRLLFETGTCVFSSPADLASFWTGPLAAAFGIESLQPAEPPAESPGDATERPEPPRGQVTPGGGAPGPAERVVRLVQMSPDEAHADDPAESPPRGRRLTVAALTEELARVVHGQDAALERVASATVAQLAKRHPARPGSVLLLGPTGVGKTSTVQALPGALRALGYGDASVFRIDCGELTDSIQVTRLLGAPPGYSGHATTTPLLTALEKPGCILLVDEVEKAHHDVRDLLLGLLDAGRLTSPSGKAVDARHTVVALTTSMESEALTRRLGRTPLDDRWAVQRACAEHLRSWGLPADLVGRIGAFAAYAELDGDHARRGIAEAAVAALGREYGLVVVGVDPVVLEVVEDIASDGGDDAGARAIQHAARELLAEAFAGLAGDGPPVEVVVEPGPPVSVRATKRVRRPA